MRLTRAVVALLVAAACGGSESATDAPGTDAPAIADAPVGVDAYLPTESRALGLNDLSFLIQLPNSAITGTTLARMTGVPGYAGDLVPRDVFAALVTAPDDVRRAYEEFHAVAIRFDLCDRGTTAPCADGEDGRLRIVFQPLITGSSAPSEALDIALHAFYPIPAAELAPMVNELRALARLRDFQTASPLAVNDLTSTAPPTEYRTRLRALVARYAVADRLVRLTLFAQDANQPPFNWIFRGVERSIGGAFEPLMIPTVDATLQRTVFVTPPWPPTFSTMPVADAPAGFALALDTDAFTAAPLAQKRTSLAALAAAQNPTLQAFGTEQCIACHVSTFLVARRSLDAQVDPATIEMTYASSHDLSISFGVAATTETSLRAFGWFHQYPVISNRVVNETAMVLDEIELRFPPAEPGVLPDARMPDAPPSVKRVFVTSSAYTADLATAGNGVDGLDGGDRLCASAAANAGLGGDWVAWLSSDTVGAIDRITGTGPWYLVDGTTLVFADKAAIATGPLVGINLDEHGAQPPDAENVWTGTHPDGTAMPGRTCLGWTTSTPDSNIAAGMTGLRTATNGGWTEYGDVLCSNTAPRLYCFEE